MENKNSLLTWSTPIIIPYDATLSTGNRERLVPNSFRQVLQLTYCLIRAEEKTMPSICQSILVQSEANIALNESCNNLYHDYGAVFGWIFLFHEL